MVQLHSASGDWFGDSPESLGVLPGAAGACVTSCPCTAACTGPGANSCSLQPWAATGGAAQGESSCDTSGGAGFNCGSRGVLWMFWVSQKGVSAAHPSALKAKVGLTILKPSGTRSFNRRKKLHYLDRRTRAY